MAASTRRQYSLVFVLRGGKVLLGHKQRGIGVGLWNGFGGKLEPSDASMTACATRELQEECGLQARAPPRRVGVFVRHNVDGALDVVHVFVVHDFTGEPRASEEMSPLRWFDVRRLPLEGMWPDAAVWLPPVLAGDDAQFFVVDARYDAAEHLQSVVQRRYESETECFEKRLL